MNKLWLIGLTASAAFAAPASAQTVADPTAAYGTEAARLSVPLAAAAAAAADDRVVMDGMRRVMRHGADRSGHHRWSRINRGGFVPSFWFGPQFVIGNWNMYGFSHPGRGRRWIRYYDDALLIDSYGRVHDGRWGYDWGRWNDRWSYRDGIPVYVGDGDFEPRGHDYEWAERWDDGRDRRGRGARRGGPPMDDCGRGRCRPMPPAPVYGHGGYGGQGGYGGYGAYGCGCGPMVVTETTTTTAPVVEMETWYEYVTEEVAAPRRAAPRRAAPARRAPVYRAPPPPRPGERG